MEGSFISFFALPEEFSVHGCLTDYKFLVILPLLVSV